MAVNRKYADALLNAIGKHGMSIMALARLCGLHHNTLYNWANARSIPDQEHWDLVRHYIPLPSYGALRVGDAK